MRIVIINCVTLNGGDAAILYALREVLYQAFGEDIELVVFDSQAEVAARHHKDFDFRQMYRPLAPAWARKIYLSAASKTVARFRWRIGCSLMRLGFRSLGLFASPSGVRAHHEAYERADLIVSTGGTYLVEHYDLAYRALHFHTASCHDAPIVLFTQSLGPFKSSRGKRLIRRVLGVTDLLLLRDRLSLRHIEAFKGPKTATSVLPDSAFILSGSNFTEQEKNYPQRDHLRVAISVRHWDHFSGTTSTNGMQQYRAAIIEAVTHLVRKEHADVTFLSTCQGIPEYWTDDSAVACQIASELPPDVAEHVSVQRKFHNPPDLLAQFATFDFVIATRMHAAILSLVSGTPVLSIAYEFKTKELFNDLGFEDWVLNIEDLDSEALISKLRTFVACLPEVRSKVKRQVTICHEGAMQAVPLIRDTYNARRSTLT